MIMQACVLLVVAAAFFLGEIQAQQTINPPEGTTVETPATFQCSIFENNEPVFIEWFIDNTPIVFAEGLGVDFMTSGESRENLTIRGFIGREIPAELLSVSCRQADPPNVVYANFILRAPLIIVRSARFTSNVTVDEGDDATLCVAVDRLGNRFDPPPFNISLQVLPQSTAEDFNDYEEDTVPSSLSFDAFGVTMQCFNISTFQDDEDSEDVETIVIQLGNTTSRNAIADPIFNIAIVTIQCTENAVRLVGGVDSTQGRVEICYNGQWGSACTSGWDMLDAQVVCRQFGFNGVPVAYTSIFGFAFGEGGSPVLDSVQCTGNEPDLLNCTGFGPTGLVECQARFAGVDCAGRGEPMFAFENGGDTPIIVAEGGSVEVCVVLASGVLTTPFEVRVGIDSEITPPAVSQVDFVVFPELDPVDGYIHLMFSPGNLRKCFTVSAIDGAGMESREETSFTLVGSPRGTRSQRVSILDNDMVCTNGTRLCVDLQQATTLCTPESRVCDGFVHCPDNSDEISCPNICPPDMYTCQVERTCLNRSRVCDSYPDCVGVDPALDLIVTVDERNCPAGCIDGTVELVGGVSRTEGAVRVCLNDRYIPLSTRGVSLVEASFICQQLGLGQAGFPSHSSFGMYPFRVSSPGSFLATISCPDSASSLSECTIGNTTMVADREVAVICIETAAACTDGAVRLSPDGPSEREGRVEVCYRGVWGAIVDMEWRSRDAAVVCRQLGFPSQGSMPVYGAVYRVNEPLPVVAESISCVGNESVLTDCPSPSPLGRPMGLSEGFSLRTNLFSVAGVRCDDYRPDGCTDLDVRLTYRDATGRSGQFEVCRGGVWQRTCNSTFRIGEADTACNQLFNTPRLSVEIMITINLTAQVLSETTGVFTEVLTCEPGQTSLRSCSEPQPDETEPSCSRDSQPTVRCLGPPVVYVSPELPDRSYTVESRSTPNVQCVADSLTVPFVLGGVTVSRPSQIRPITLPRQGSRRSVKRGAEAASIQNIFGLREVFSFDTGQYACTASNSLNTRREELSVQVLVGEGRPEFAFIQFSIVNSIRLGNSLTANPQTYAFFLTSLINERTPGVQSVNCELIPRRPIDEERGFERMQCEIVHFNRSDETEVTTARAIAERLTSQLPIVVAFVADAEVTEYPEVAFTSPNSTGVEGDVLTICLAVVSGEITTPTNVTLTTNNIVVDGPGGLPPDLGEGSFTTFVGEDYTVSVPFTRSGEVGINIVLTFEPGQTQSCFDLTLVDDNFREDDLETLTFSYVSSSPGVARFDLTHQVYILDNDRNCVVEIGPGSRVCANTLTQMVSCLEPALVCDYQVVNCPDMSDELNCPSPLESIVNQTITNENVANVSTAVSSFAAVSANSTLLQTSEFLMDVSTVFGNIADFASIVTVNSSVVEDLVVTLNSLTQWQPSNLIVSNTSSIVESFEVVITTFAQKANFKVELSDITVVAELGTTEMFMATGRTEDFSSRAGVPASISLPPTLFNDVPADRPLIGVYFALYENPALLPAIENTASVRGNDTDIRVGSPIVAATVGPGIDFVDLDPPVSIRLGVRPDINNLTFNLRTARCVSWDFPSQSWTTDGCTTEIIDPTTFLCSCTHLTNFAVLVDICLRTQENCASDPVVDQVLEVVTYVGVVVSCIGLIITVITLLAFKKLRERDNTPYHIQLSVALFCMLVVFAAGVGAVDVYAGCIIVSILIHYFSLAAVMWMGAEALLLFQKLVIVFTRITKKFIVILSLVCWLVPLIPVLIPMIVDLADGTNADTDLIITRNYNLTTNTLSGFCFHKHPGVFFGAFLGPILAIILFNVVIFIWVVVILIRHTKGQLKRSKEGFNTKTAVRLIISISGIMFLFGLTWLFAVFTFTIAGNNELRITFQALFTVFASFQGFFIFLFFCVFNKEARESWRELLSCGRYKSEFLHPSQYKNTSSAGSGTTRNKLKTGNTTTSTYQSNIIPRSVEASPLPEKRDLGKTEEGIHTEIPLTATSGTDEGVLKESKIEVESKIDGKEDSKVQQWTEAEPVKKARVKRYSTKKNSKHHVEEYQVDFGGEESDEETEEQPPA